MTAPQFFTILVFIIINFLILFNVKTRTTTIIGLIIAHLIAVLFFSISISNYNSFKEIVLALIIYSMMILFLISNYNAISFDDERSIRIKHPYLAIVFYFTVAVFFLAVFFAVFSVTKNIAEFSEIANEKKFNKQEEAMLNPMILPSHPVHIAVKKFYLGKKFEDELPDKVSAALEVNERKRARLKDRLMDNFLLKRSSDVILIIVAVSASLLLMSHRKPTES